jgi:hypothetical protein
MNLIKFNNFLFYKIINVVFNKTQEEARRQLKKHKKKHEDS